MTKHPKFQIFKGQDNQFYFRLKAQNGEIILASEGYTAKQSAEDTIDVARKLGQDASKFDKRTATDGSPYFVLVANNNEIIGVSEMYSSVANRDNGIQAVINVIGTAQVEDLTDQAASSPVTHPKFQIFKGADNQFYFRLKASNGQIILASEGYVAKAGAQNGIDSVKNNAKPERFDKKMSANNQYYFNQKAANGEIIGTSEMYLSEAGRDNGIQAVINAAGPAAIEDTTLATA